MEEYVTAKKTADITESYTTCSGTKSLDASECTETDPDRLPDLSQSGLYERELQQKIHYFLLHELQKMAAELPGRFQQRLPYDLLSGLANSLLDGTVVEIARSLREVQHLEEKNLCAQRAKLAADFKTQRQDLKRRRRDLEQECHAHPHRLGLVQAQCDKDLQALEQRAEEELKRRDMKTILDLDQKVMEQQVTFEKAGVPGFHVTNSPQDIRLQMYLLEFITRLSDMEWPS